MRQELDMADLDQVVGGSVIITDGGTIAFRTIRKAFKLKSTTWKEARSVVEDMLDQNPQATDKEFDELVLSTFSTNGWI